MRSWLLSPATATQLGRIRVLVVGYCLAWSCIRLPFWLDQAALPVRRRDPVGVLSIFGTTFSGTTVVVVFAMMIVAGVFGLFDKGWTFTGPVTAAGFLLLTTHGNSWGQVLHTENLPALHLLVLAAGPAGAGLQHLRLRNRHDNIEHRVHDSSFGWPIRVLTLVTLATYVIAGVAKIRYGGGDWFRGETLQRLVAHDNLRTKLLGDPSSPIAPLIVNQGWLFGPGAIIAVVVELGAPIALISRRLALSWAALAWVFHFLVLTTMAVLFLYPLLGLAFLPLGVRHESSGRGIRVDSIVRVGSGQ
jgi:hypothetical protein